MRKLYSRQSSNTKPTTYGTRGGRGREKYTHAEARREGQQNKDITVVGGGGLQSCTLGVLHLIVVLIVVGRARRSAGSLLGAAALVVDRLLVFGALLVLVSELNVGLQEKM